MPKWQPRFMERETEGSIYFARCLDFVKIGFTSGDPEARVKNLGVANPHDVTLLFSMYGNVEFEARLHEQFSEHHHRGEWFVFAEPIQDFIGKARREIALAAAEELRLARKLEAEQKKTAERNIRRRRAA